MSSEEQASESKSETGPVEDTGKASPMSKTAQKPHTHAWWKNTYFWLAAILLLVGMAGLLGGPKLIRDPGQKREDNLVTMLYFVGAVVMLVNGWLSHRQTMRELEEENK